MAKKIMPLGLAAVALVVAGIAAAATESPETFLKAVNGDKDHTLSLAEVQAFALKRFDALDGNKDGTLSKDELGDRLSAEDFAAADAKGKAARTLSKTEFSLYVSKLFAAANVDVGQGHTKVDGTLSAKELATSAGSKLIKLLE